MSNGENVERLCSTNLFLLVYFILPLCNASSTKNITAYGYCGGTKTKSFRLKLSIFKLWLTNSCCHCLAQNVLPHFQFCVFFFCLKLIRYLTVLQKNPVLKIYCSIHLYSSFNPVISLSTKVA